MKRIIKIHLFNINEIYLNMKKTFFNAVILVLMIPFFTGTTFAQKKYQLKYKLHQGDKYNYSMNMKQDVSFEANGQTVTLNQTITFGMTMLIEKGKQSKTFKIETTIDKMTMKQKIFGMEMYYDSEDSSTFSTGMGQKLGETFNKIIGKSFSATIDEFGNLKDMDMSNISESGIDFTQNLNQSANFAVFPNHKVAVGDSWESNGNPLTNSKMNVHTKYTLLKVKGKKVIIGFNSTITAKSGSDSKINGTLTGKMTINRKTGWLHNSNIDQEMKMDINQSGNKIPADLTSTIEINSKKL